MSTTYHIDEAAVIIGALSDITLAEANNQMHESDDIVKKCDDTKPVSKTSQYLKPMN